MRSISTMRGDAGETSLAGGVRVSKGSLRVETYGTVDELNSSLGFARSICEDAEMAAFTKGVQQDLFKIGSSLATPAESPKPQIVIDPALSRTSDRRSASAGSDRGDARRLVDSRRASSRGRLRRGSHDLPPGGTVPGAAAGIRRRRSARDPLLREPAVRPAVAVWPQARTRCRRQRLVARRHRQDRQSLLPRLVALDEDRIDDDASACRRP